MPIDLSTLEPIINKMALVSSIYYNLVNICEKN